MDGHLATRDADLVEVADRPRRPGRVGPAERDDDGEKGHHDPEDESRS